MHKAEFFRNDTWTSPQTNVEESPKIPLVYFFNSRWPPPCNGIVEKTGVYPNSSLLQLEKKYLGVSTYVLRHKEFIPMIRNDISTFLTTKNQDGRYIVLSMLSDLLKKRKYKVTISLLNLAKPMASIAYLDHQYFIILNLSTEIPHNR